LRNALFLTLILTCSGLISPALPLNTAHATPVARIVAVINGDMITARELDRAVEPELLTQKLDPKNPAHADRIDTVKRQALESMVNERILMQEAEKQGIKISDERIDNALEAFIADSQLSREEFMRQLAQQGLTLDAMRERMRVTQTTQQLIGRMVVGRVVVTDEEIAEYYRQHMGELPSGQVRVALIIYPAGENAEDWAGRIASGQESFAGVARKVSVGPNAQDGGDLGYMNVDDLAHILQQQVALLKKGDVSEVFDMQVNKAQISLLDVTSAEEAPQAVPDAATAARIEEILKAPRLDVRFREYTRQLREKALVDIRY